MSGTLAFQAKVEFFHVVGWDQFAQRTQAHHKHREMVGLRTATAVLVPPYILRTVKKQKVLTLWRLPLANRARRTARYRVSDSWEKWVDRRIKRP